MLFSGYKGISIVIWETKDVLECPPAPAECAFPTGQSVLDYLEFEGGNGQLWLNAFVLVSRGLALREASERAIKVEFAHGIFGDLSTSNHHHHHQ